MQPSACHFHDLSIGGKEEDVFGRGILAFPTPHSNLPSSNYLGALVWSWGASGPGATGAQVLQRPEYVPAVSSGVPCTLESCWQC